MLLRPERAFSWIIHAGKLHFVTLRKPEFALHAETGAMFEAASSGLSALVPVRKANPLGLNIMGKIKPDFLLKISSL